ncbi:hypothetical protein [Paenibacillus riograndensis]|uniref:Uncharacterized protein n=1 Tax=Paenibacillus riograndensis SBR5 TaxID=1073571 RepID=A0A0E3WJJ1_9BACL|nr:hypothetical protein [Paenibacillus riograndensis]CQR58878.1 hypothetical protein PRIO_6531 [Paenibacillus riograndensis SBR5]
MARPTQKRQDRIIVIIQKGSRKIITRTPLAGVDRLVFVINNQYTNAANTTQIASGAGRSSASGSNAAIASPFTRQQQSVGAGGDATNLGSRGQRGSKPHFPLPSLHGKEVVVVINNQTVKLPKGSKTSSATQVGSGGGTYSAGGTNAAIDSPATRQQQAVGGGTGGHALNKASSKRRRSSRRLR